MVGCGRVGSQLANMLSDNGNNVCCIDKNADAFANLGRNFNGSTVQGVGFDEDVLIRAGVEECDVLAAVTQLDNTNLMCAEVANHLFGVPHVISRLYNPDHERAYMQLGIDYVCGTSLVAEVMVPRMRHFSNEDGVLIDEVPLPDNAIIAAIASGGDVEVANDETVLHPGDKAIVVADEDVLDDVRLAFRGLEWLWKGPVACRSGRNQGVP